MPRNERHRQRTLQHKAAKRKAKHRAVSVRHAPAAPSSALLRVGATWPVHECLVSREWQDPKEIVQVLVARHGPSGEIAAGVFLVDLACLGVKNAFVTFDPSRAEYEGQVRRVLTTSQKMVKADLDLAAKIIRDGIAYARRWGFSPHRDYHDAADLLTGANPDACTTPIPLGVNGKPFFIAGPYDDAPRIIKQLMKTAGPGNFDTFAVLEAPADFL